jgi:methylene-fatty-acyl-phospholipid synthase
LLFKIAIEDQPRCSAFYSPLLNASGVGLIFFGSVFVLSSMYKLGMIGTYLGDCTVYNITFVLLINHCIDFGILMKEKVISFPFDTLQNPMYTGSSMIFLGTALWHSSLCGIIISFLVSIVYNIAIMFEG